ncbi:MAG: Nif3-like dinuclear metal center hexameric protein [Desulfobacterales bacterium]
MAVRLGEILPLLEEIAPPALAEPWDRVGLQIGDPERPLRRVRVVLEATEAAVDEACRDGVDLLVVHHPLLFHPLARIDTASAPGRILGAVLGRGLCLYAMHTNLDAAPGGLNDIFARRIGLGRVRPLVPRGIPGSGLGRWGVLARPRRLQEIAAGLKREFQVPGVRVVGDPSRRIRRVAVCTGSGSGLVGDFLSSPAEVFITGELRYHDARDIEAAGKTAVDMGHFHSERWMPVAVAERLRRLLRRRRLAVAVDERCDEQGPFQNG